MCREAGDHPDEAVDVGGRGNGRPPRLQRRNLLERMRRVRLRLLQPKLRLRV